MELIQHTISNNTMELTINNSIHTVIIIINSNKVIRMVIHIHKQELNQFLMYLKLLLLEKLSQLLLLLLLPMYSQAKTVSNLKKLPSLTKPWNRLQMNHQQLLIWKAERNL